MKKKRIRFPIIVKRGSSVVKIYRDRKPENTYYRVVYYLGGERHRLNFNDLQEATNEAEAKASQLSRGDMDATQLSGKDRLEYGRACDAVKDFKLPLDAVAIQYAEARKLLDGVPLIDAAGFYARHHGKGIMRKSVASAVDEMIERKTQKGVSELYLADLRYRLGVFGQAFHCDVNDITPNDVVTFLDGLKLSPRSHNNFLGALRTFFRFAQKHKWLSKEADLLALVEKRNGKLAPVEIFTSKELGALLKAATPQVAPCIALSAFAGLRSEEILRLDWSDVELRPGFIEVAAHKAKTRSRRLIPISDNLSRWLAIAPRKGERVWPHGKAYFFEALRNSADNGKVKWKQNALRHSYISYRLADIQNENIVAFEAGNSPKMIYKHYRELATPEQARTWFAIAPEAASNVVPITASNARR